MDNVATATTPPLCSFGTSDSSRKKTAPVQYNKLYTMYSITGREEKPQWSLSCQQECYEYIQNPTVLLPFGPGAETPIAPPKQSQKEALDRSGINYRPKDPHQLPQYMMDLKESYEKGMKDPTLNQWRETHWVIPKPTLTCRWEIVPKKNTSGWDSNNQDTRPVSSKRPQDLQRSEGHGGRMAAAPTQLHKSVPYGAELKRLQQKK